MAPLKWMAVFSCTLDKQAAEAKKRAGFYRWYTRAVFA